MAGKFQDRVFDGGLSVLDLEATHLVLLASEPTQYSDAALASSNCLAYKDFTAGGCFGTPAASSSPAGEKTASVAVPDGTIQHSGTANFWAAIDSVNARLLAHNALASAVSLTEGDQFSMASFDCIFPSGA